MKEAALIVGFMTLAFLAGSNLSNAKRTSSSLAISNELANSYSNLIVALRLQIAAQDWETASLNGLVAAHTNHVAILLKKIELLEASK